MNPAILLATLLCGSSRPDDIWFEELIVASNCVLSTEVDVYVSADAQNSSRLVRARTNGNLMFRDFFSLPPRHDIEIETFQKMKKLSTAVFSFPQGNGSESAEGVKGRRICIYERMV